MAHFRNGDAANVAKIQFLGKKPSLSFVKQISFYRCKSKLQLVSSISRSQRVCASARKTELIEERPNDYNEHFTLSLAEPFVITSQHPFADTRAMYWSFLILLSSVVVLRIFIYMTAIFI